MMKIRKAKKEDFEKIDEIYTEGSITECQLQFPKIPLSELKKDLKEYKSSRSKEFFETMKSKNHYWIVAEEKEIVGFGQSWLKTKGIGVIEKLYVSKSFARKGIGRKMLKDLEKWLISTKIKFIEVGIYYNNKPSIALHSKSKYLPVRIRMRKDIKN